MLVGCGEPEDTTPPAATAAVSLSRAKVALGSPVEVTYKFTMAADAPSLGQRRVFVHFLDADEELMWTDDHTPPVPTSTWKPGQRVEYTRTIFIPVYPYVGEALVTVGLYAPGSNDRLPLAGDLLGQREYRAARLQLQPQFDSVLVVFKDGWHPSEAAPDNPALEWQWTRKESTLSFRNPRSNATLFLHYDGQPQMVNSPQTVTVRLHGEVIDTFQVASARDEIRRIPLKAAQFGADELVEIALQVDQTFVPALAAGGGSRDPRELGIRVFHAYVEPQ
jgi:hypothetical protein